MHPFRAALAFGNVLANALSACRSGPACHDVLPGKWAKADAVPHAGHRPQVSQQGMDPPSGHPPVDVPGAPKAAQSYSALLVRYLVRYSSPTVRY